MKGKVVLAAVAVAVLVRNKSWVVRALFEVLHKVRVAMLKRGVMQRRAEEFFDKPDEANKASPELLAFVEIVNMTPIPRGAMSFAETVGAFEKFYELNLFHAWTGTAHKTERVKLEDGTKAVWYAHPGAVALDKAILFAHGGGYVSGTEQSYAGFCAKLSEVCSCRVLFVDYTLAPRKTVKGVQDELLTAYHYLIKDAGVDPRKIVVAGDSAGGGLALGLLMRIVSEKAPVPAAGVLFSPWCDLTNQARSMEVNSKDVFFKQRAMFDVTSAGVVAASALDAGHPENSSLFGSYDNLPPLYVCAGTSEKLVDDSLAVIERARAAGVRVEAELHPHGVHIYPLFTNFRVPEFQAGLDRVTKFIDAAFSGSHRPSL